MWQLNLVDWLREFQLTAEDKQQFHKLLTELRGPINEATQIADELAKRLRSGESSTSKVCISSSFILVLFLTVK